VNRGEVYDVDWPGLGLRPVVIVTRPAAIPHLTNVTVVLVATRVRGLPTEVELGAGHGLIEGCVANCHNVLTVPKTAVGGLGGALGTAELRALDDALRIALALD
jgi:mRNA interferase MazF